MAVYYMQATWSKRAAKLFDKPAKAVKPLILYPNFLKRKKSTYMLKILYITHEMDPYTGLTELSEVARVLPQAIQSKGMEVRVFMPRYGRINERKHRLHEVIRLSGINITVADEDNPMIIKVASLPIAKIQIYFLDNEEFFYRKNFFHDDDEKFFTDNDLRTLFFNKGAIQIATKLGWEPDIIHCHGWMGNLVPMIARTVYKNEPVFKNAKIIFSTYSNYFDHPIGKNYLANAQLNIPNKQLTQGLNYNNPNCLDLYKIGVTYSDGIINSSNGSMQELHDYIDSLGKPVLKQIYTPEQEEEYVNANKTFYEQMVS
jgi:starch synthase